MTVKVENSLEYLEQVMEETQQYQDLGVMASYIPELLKADPKAFSLCYADVNGSIVSVGSTDQTFTLQSVSKVITFGMAIQTHGKEQVFKYVGTENGGMPFDDIRNISEKVVNPMVNAGAIAVAGLLHEHYGSRVSGLIAEEVKKLAGVDQVCHDMDVYYSELATATKNKAIAHYLYHMGLLPGQVEEVLETYILQCALLGDTQLLAKIGATLANGGVRADGVRVWSRDTVEVVVAVMANCGMYDHSGDYMARVGIPSKSGVSGCLMGVAPGKGGVSSYAPNLNEFGNSLRGTLALESLSKKMGLNIFIP